MDEAQLKNYLQNNFPEEGNACEHKQFGNLRHSFSGQKGEDIISYVSAMANMEGGHLVIGVKDNTLDIIGIKNFGKHQKNNACHTIKELCPNLNSEGLRCEEITTSDTGKTVWIIHIPKHKSRLPVYAHKIAWQRIDECLAEITQERLDAILNETLQGDDWSAVVMPEAKISDLDADALAGARKKFRDRNINESWCADFDSWSDDKFLDRARLTINGQQTRASLLLLGKSSATHFLSPHPAQITWYFADDKNEYLHVGPPFFLNTTRILEKINARNSPQKLFPKNQLLPVEVIKFETKSILEALHNCIAHQNYDRHARIVVSEFSDRVVFENAGSFFQGQAEDYFRGDLTPDQYRNPWLAQAMHEIRMIDTMGFGISQMTQLQRSRYLPLPDYSHSTDMNVRLEIHGSPIDERYSQLLLERQDLDIDTVILLDRVQKNLDIPLHAQRKLRRDKLIEGTRSNLRVTASVAKATGTQAKYTQQKGMETKQIKELVKSHLNQFPGSTRPELNQLLFAVLSLDLTEKQKRDKITNVLSSMKNTDKSVWSEGRGPGSKWYLVK